MILCMETYPVRCLADRWRGQTANKINKDKVRLSAGQVEGERETHNHDTERTTHKDTTKGKVNDPDRNL